MCLVLASVQAWEGNRVTWRDEARTCLNQALTSRSLSWKNMDVTETVIRRLAARGGLQKGVNPIEPPPC